MCGIFGTSNFRSFEKLYNDNKIRGNFSHGFLFVSKNRKTYIRKGPGLHDLKTEKDWISSNRYNLYLGHTQAPTSSKRTFSDKTTHPFISDKFVIAHNGVLENHSELCKSKHINVPEIDSEAICILLNELYLGDDIAVIKELFSQLLGTFACWIYSKTSSKCYLVRSGSTLFFNDIKTEFSSTKTDTHTIPASDGVIYEYTPEGYTSVENFSSNSAFFM